MEQQTVSPLNIAPGEKPHHVSRGRMTHYYYHSDPMLGVGNFFY